ncbi:MAG: CHAT domain-containing protein, partial [Pirellulales bacterium]
RWFVAALARKDVPLALEIAERAKRRRFLSSRPLGGRLAALRTILEAPEAELSKEALLLRQQILTSFPAYRALADAGRRLYEQLRGGPILPIDPADTKPLAALYEAWEKNVNQRAGLLAQFAPRRLASTIEFPPLRTVPELQKTLRDGEAIIAFHSAAGGLHGFLLTQADVHAWQIRDMRRLRSGLGEFLRDLGNYGANRPLPIAELKSDAWRKSANAMYEALFADARLDLAKTTSLVIVPDDVLWYLPFEALVPGGANADAVLADRVAIRYGPLASLAVANQRALRRPQRTGIVANKLAADNTAAGDALIQELEKVVSGAVRLPTPLPEPAYLVAALLDGLISLDDIEVRAGTDSGWSPLPRSRTAADDTISLGLPYGGPDRVVITGFGTEAEQGLKSSRRSASRRARPGDEVFQSLCGLMGDSARIILLTRWRTSGRTNFELVREFARELPHAPATEAWQRACLLARESPLEAAREPRLKRIDEATAELPTADHPFFWAGYLLVDTGPRAIEETDVKDDEELQKAATEKADSEEAEVQLRSTSAPPQSDDDASEADNQASPTHEDATSNRSS